MSISNREAIDLNGKSVAVIGAGRSGLSAPRLLMELGAKVFLSEADKNIDADELKTIGVPFETGGHSEKVNWNDLMVVSPGVPQDSDVVTRAKSAGIPVVSEIELASWFTATPIAAVTGSNGKTTTTSILAEMCRQAGLTT